MKIAPNFSINKGFEPQSFKAEQQKTATAANLQQKPVPAPTLLAYMLGKSLKTQSLNIKFYNSPSISELDSKYGEIARKDITELAQRASKPGQVLNWIESLPAEQLKRLDEIYALADSMKKNGGKKLGIIGIGGSKHTIENLLSLNGKSDNIIFLSAVDPESMDKFVEKLGDLKGASIMIASKSGTTLEPSTGYEYVEKKFVEKFKNDYIAAGLNENEAQKAAETEAAKHFVSITDKNPQASRLRKISEEKGYKTGVIHDDCGGRFGAFDDHALTALAYAGMSKEDMKKMLQSAQKAQKKFLSADINNNPAAQRALFNADCILKGKTNQYDYYFGDRFEGTKLWNTQMKKESHKALYKPADLIGPEFLHNSTESDLDSGNTTSFYTFNTIKNGGTNDYKAYNALVGGSLKAYSQRHPVSVIEFKDFSPETIGEYVELKHFEAIYTGMFSRSLKGAAHPQVLPEVEQPNVKIYKREVESLLKA
ncbi:TPA: hypothetical protein IAD52_08100 [Candidatus Spyradomonas excrementavium]|nr:hypothetical protein [Candidatus Spyradomonas excrementavium]